MWRKGRMTTTEVELFRDKTADLRGYELRVVVFEHFLAVLGPNKNITVDDVKLGLKGVETEIVRALADAMNFAPSFYEAPNADTEKWGRPINGSFSGMIGELVNRRADLALGNLYYSPFNLRLMDLSVPYDTQCLTFVTPETMTDISWKTLILPFKPVMWAAILVTLFLGGFIFFALARYHRSVETSSPRQRSTRGKKEDTGLFVFSELGNGILYTYGMLLLVSLPKVPIGWSIRLLTGWWWLYCVLVVVAYRASMTAILANPAPKVVIDTVEELAAARWVIAGGWGEQNKHFFLTSLDTAGQVVGDKMEVLYDTRGSVKRVTRGEFAFYENVYFLRDAVVRVQTEEHNTSGRFPLHIMQECVVHMPISIGLQQNSPLKYGVDKVIRRVIEVGLVDKWLRDVMSETRAKEKLMNTEGTKALMNLRKLYGALVMLGVGYVLGAAALLGEHIHWKCVVQKSPLFDKYRMHLYYNQPKKKVIQVTFK